MYISIKIKRIFICIILLVFALSGCVLISSGKQPAVPAAANTEQAGVELPIIMYHSILKDKARHGQYVISPDELEADLKWIVENDYTCVTVSDLIAYTNNDASLPPKPIMLTFDDGYYNNYLYALPLLKKYNCRAVIGVIGKYTQQFTDTPDPNAYYSHCTWDNLNEMLDSGCFEVQSHSYDLHKSSGDRLGSNKKSGEKSEDYKKLLTDDLSKLENAFIKNLGVCSQAFVYPFGAYCDEEEGIVREMGFKCTLTCDQKINYITRNPDCLYKLGRYLRPSKKGVDKILN